MGPSARVCAWEDAPLSEICTKLIKHAQKSATRQTATRTLCAQMKWAFKNEFLISHSTKDYVSLFDFLIVPTEKQIMQWTSFMLGLEGGAKIIVLCEFYQFFAKLCQISIKLSSFCSLNHIKIWLFSVKFSLNSVNFQKKILSNCATLLFFSQFLKHFW